MKYLKTFESFKINEAYRELDRSDYENKYDYDFANYALNERPFGWSEEDIKKARELYGNRDVGVVYHGGKLDNKEFNDKVRALKPGDTIKVKLMSSTPEYSTAESFALYVKSYDEMTMMYALKDAIDNGSAGEYGTYVVTLKPKPEQVIVANFGEGKKPTSSAETEAVLYGDIEVVDVKIFDPLNKETYLEDFMEMHPNSLDNDFMKRWFRSKRLERPDSDYIKKILSKIKNEDEAIEFIEKQYSGGWVFDYVTLDEFMSNKFLKKQMDKIIFKDGHFEFDFGGKRNPGVSAIKGLKEYVWKNNKKVLLDYYNELLKDPEIDMNFKESSYSMGDGEHQVYINDKARKLLLAYKKLIEVGQKPKMHPKLEELENELEKYFDDNIIGKHIKDVSVQELEGIERTLQNIGYYGQILNGIIDKNVLTAGLVYLYQNFAHRWNMTDKDDSNKMYKYKRIVEKALQLLTAK
jgi:hypothetical protein